MPENLVLDRDALSRKQFWQRFREACDAGQSVQIITKRQDVRDLPGDLKLALWRAEKRNAVTVAAATGASAGAIGTVATAAGGAGVAVLTAKIIVYALIAAVSLAGIGAAIYMVSQRYRFRIELGGDGHVVIQAEPG